MSETIDEMYDHFLWSTKRLIGLLQEMDNDQFTSKQSKNIRSVREIILHLISIYGYFISPTEHKSIMEQNNKSAKGELLETYRDLTKGVYKVFKSDIEKAIPVKTKAGKIKNITGITLFHMVINHYAYHRGQLITKFRTITGKDSVDTDFAVFLMEDEPEMEL